MHNDRKSRKQVWTITENNCIFICPLQLCLSLFLSLVFVMLVNLLIAMMGDTYTRIAEIKNEWMRQVKLYIKKSTIFISFLQKISYVLVGKNGTDYRERNHT